MEKAKMALERANVSPYVVTQRRGDTGGFADGRAVAEEQAELQELANASGRVAQLREAADVANAAHAPAMHVRSLAAPINKIGMPERLKGVIDARSGFDMSIMRVHRNSDKPTKLNAHAYAQGSDIHLAPGQEQDLPHAARHVVQQMQGRVRPTMQLKVAGLLDTDDHVLEKEADVLGAESLRPGVAWPLTRCKPMNGAIQCVIKIKSGSKTLTVTEAATKLFQKHKEELLSVGVKNLVECEAHVSAVDSGSAVCKSMLELLTHVREARRSEHLNSDAVGPASSGALGERSREDAYPVGSSSSMAPSIAEDTAAPSSSLPMLEQSADATEIVQRAPHFTQPSKSDANAFHADKGNSMPRWRRYLGEKKNPDLLKGNDGAYYVRLPQLTLQKIQDVPLEIRGELRVDESGKYYAQLA